MSYINVLSLYESVAEVTSQMLEAAQEQDWDRLRELEDYCGTYVEKLKAFEELEPLTGDAYARKLTCIKKILADDREIRNLMAPWMVKLNAMLNRNHARNTTPRSYGS
ncbi:MAG: flagellar protein FliT [Methylophilaceae bacterium]